MQCRWTAAQYVSTKPSSFLAPIEFHKISYKDLFLHRTTHVSELLQGSNLQEHSVSFPAVQIMHCILT